MKSIEENKKQQIGTLSYQQAMGQCVAGCAFVRLDIPTQIKHEKKMGNDNQRHYELHRFDYCVTPLYAG